MTTERKVAKLLELGFEDITDDIQGVEAQDSFSATEQSEYPLFVRTRKVNVEGPITLAFFPSTGCVYFLEGDKNLLLYGFRDVSFTVFIKEVKNMPRHE